MQVSKIFDSVRANLRQRGQTGNFSSQALVTYLNDILLEVADEIQDHRKILQATPDPDGRIPIPDDLLRIDRVNVNFFELPPLSPSLAVINDGQSVGGVFGYIVVDDYIQLLPKYDQPANITYIARPLFVDNEAQTIDVNEANRMAYVYGITWKCFLEIDKMDKANTFRQLYEEQLRNRRRQVRSLTKGNAKAPFIQRATF